MQGLGSTDWNGQAPPFVQSLSLGSDNLKSAVFKASKYEPGLNKAFKDFAFHYGSVIDPGRHSSPQDKALLFSIVIRRSALGRNGIINLPRL